MSSRVSLVLAASDILVEYKTYFELIKLEFVFLGKITYCNENELKSTLIKVSFAALRFFNCSD